MPRQLAHSAALDVNRHVDLALDLGVDLVVGAHEDAAHEDEDLLARLRRRKLLDIPAHQNRGLRAVTSSPHRRGLEVGVAVGVALGATVLLVASIAGRGPDASSSAATWAAASVLLPRFSMDGAVAPPDDDGVLQVLVIADDDRTDEADAKGVTSSRADSLTLWVLTPRGVVAVALPRDLRVPVTGVGEEKLSGTLEHGPAAATAAVSAVVGARVDHVVVVRFEGFRRAIDDLGGIQLDVPDTIRDPSVGLLLEAGPQRLDGTMALQYARSRTPQLLVGGRWVPNEPGDLKRLTRQRQVVAALLATLRATPLPSLALHAGTVLGGGGLRADAGMDAATLGLIADALASAAPVTFCTVPTEWQVPDSEAVSPFGPPHNGSVDFRVLGSGADALVSWLQAPTGDFPASACAPPAESS